MIPLRKPMFEPGPITEPEDFIDDAQSLLKEIHLIFQIVDTLQLNMQDDLLKKRRLKLKNFLSRNVFIQSAR